jgi:hypothetical protein
MTLLTSPFPGMDPYLESRWPEVHASLIVYGRNQINSKLPDDLQANIEETLAVYADEEFDHAIRPDVHLSGDADGFRAELSEATDRNTVVVSEPIFVKLPPHPTRHIEITGRGGRVVTAIEFISPWNKVGRRARDQYTRKQNDYIAAGVNLVEIDLVRQGDYVLAVPLAELKPEQLATYMMCVYRDIQPDQMEIYRAPLQESLPNIPIPLRPGERDIPLQLQLLIDDCYRDGRYHRTDYQVPPKATFATADTAWIDACLRDAGRRV